MSVHQEQSKSILAVLTFIALIIITIISFLPGRKEVSSVFLTAEMTEDDTTIRTDYVDENGHVTFASDFRYSTIIKTQKDGKVIREEYFDEHGYPAEIWNGSYGLSYVYNDKDQVEWLHYFNASGDPVVLKSGYDSIYRTYDKDGRALSDTYYVDGEQVECKEGYCYIVRGGFDEQNRPTDFLYLDQDEKPILHKNGYAHIKREYYDEGWHIKRDFYYDTDGNPTTSDLGQYGYYQEYDDNWHETLIAYLDANGNFMNTDKGYAMIRTIYNYENKSIKKIFLDKDENPVTIGRNQYGTEEVNGQTFFLNADGTRMQRIDTIMFNNPLFVLILGIALTLLVYIALYHNSIKGRNVLLMVGVGIIIIMTMLFRNTGEIEKKILLFDSFKSVFSSRSILHSVINNIWLFVPFGAVLYKARSKRWLIPILISILIEIVQLVIGMGTFDLADIVCNSLGGLIGYALMSGLLNMTKGRFICHIKTI